MTKKLGILILVAAFAVTTGYAQVATTPAAVTGAGRATFGPGAVLNGVSLSTLRFGIGVDIAADGTATGDFQTTLLGAQSRRIVVEGKVNAGSNGVTGTTFSGTCSVDLGDGSAAATGVPFTVTVGGGGSTLGLVIGTTALPAASVSAGSVRVK